MDFSLPLYDEADCKYAGSDRAGIAQVPEYGEGGYVF